MDRCTVAALSLTVLRPSPTISGVLQSSAGKALFSGVTGSSYARSLKLSCPSEDVPVFQAASQSLALFARSWLHFPCCCALPNTPQASSPLSPPCVATERQAQKGHPAVLSRHASARAMKPILTRTSWVPTKVTDTLLFDVCAGPDSSFRAVAMLEKCFS